MPAPESAPEPQSRPRSAPRRGTTRTRRLVWLTVGFTTLVGAAWTSVATSLVERTQDYLSERVDIVQGKPEIRRLNEVIAAKQTEYDQLLASTGSGITAFHFLPFRSRQFCVDEVKAWAREGGFRLTEPSDPTLFITWIDYFGAALEFRCVGANFGNVTFLTIAGTAANQRKIDAAQSAIGTRLSQLNSYPEVASPKDQNWTSPGPYMEVGYVYVDLTYAEYQRWQNSGMFPPTLVGTLTRPSTKIRNYQANGWSFLTVDEPGSSLTLRNPGNEGYLLQAADGTWKPGAEVLQPGMRPADGAIVRAEILAAVSGLNYGQYSVDSPNARYLAQDAMARFGTAPGVVNGGAMTSLLRSW